MHDHLANGTLTGFYLKGGKIEWYKKTVKENSK